ncbi:MAG TPA: F0F1 ATP synthase subunit epsilon [Syntrophales bacterium]|nr:F0F1 ATP synthase subunit epsilon [Syntrophales bacterium]HPQ59893.1 F0F1 ATP synthase subunit epsilon [Syntrophales bacterium]
MAEELMLEIATPDRLVFSDTVEMVTIPGGDGEFGVLIGHAPLLSTVNAGEMNFNKQGKKTYYAVGKGYVEVTFRKVTMLLSNAERADLVNKEKARKSREEAEQELAKLSREDEGYEKVKDALDWAEARLKAAEKA